VQFREPEKEHPLKSLGVDHVVDSTSDNIISNAREYLKSRNLKEVDVLYGHVGEALERQLEAFKLGR
jgi:NADPH2:quinone reductase